MSDSAIRLTYLAACAAALLTATAHARVVLNEIHYHPANDAVQAGEDAEGLQFVEVLNDGPDPVLLSGASFSSGLTFTFPAGTQLAAGGYAVVAQDPDLLSLRGPLIPAAVPVFRWASGVLANGGETVRLVDANALVLDEVTFDDAGAWPGDADGLGSSLELSNPSYDNVYPMVWRASPATNGTPGAPNGAFTEGPVLASVTPERGALVESLDSISVTFAEPVAGVAPADLVVDGSAAVAVACPTCARPSRSRAC